MKFERFSSGRGFRHQLPNQTTADSRVAMVRQQRDVPEHDRCLGSVDQKPADRAAIKKNDLAVYMRLRSLTSKELHPDKSVLLIVVPPETFQLVEARAGVDFQQKGLVFRRRIA